MKRFTETEKWNDPWFRKLAPNFKLLWDYLYTRCDNSGVWVIDWESAAFHIGIVFNQEEAQAVFSGRVQDIGRGRWWIPKFIAFQFGDEFNPEKSRVHKSIENLLRRHGLYTLWIAYREGLDRAQDKDKDKDQAQDKDKDKVLEKGSGEKPSQAAGMARVPDGELPSLEQVKAAVMTSGIPDEFIELVYETWAGRSGKDGAGVAIEIVRYVRSRWAREQADWRSGTHRLKRPVNGHAKAPEESLLAKTSRQERQRIERQYGGKNL